MFVYALQPICAFFFKLTCQGSIIILHPKSKYSHVFKLTQLPGELTLCDSADDVRRSLLKINVRKATACVVKTWALLRILGPLAVDE